MRFILTMRNVNEKLEEKIYRRESCFILTMRNVNQEGNSFTVQNILGFILTMRNVNCFMCTLNN